MHILRVNVTFYDAVNIIHDVITIHYPFPYTAKFMFVGVRNNETQQIRRWKINRIRTWCCRISKISNSVERNDNFLAKARKLSILSTSLDIFDIRQHYIHILYNWESPCRRQSNEVCSFFFSFPTKENIVENGKHTNLFLTHLTIFSNMLLKEFIKIHLCLLDVYQRKIDSMYV